MLKNETFTFSIEYIFLSYLLCITLLYISLSTIPILNPIYPLLFACAREAVRRLLIPARCGRLISPLPHRKDYTMRVQAKPCLNCQRGRAAAGSAVSNLARGNVSQAARDARVAVQSVSRAARISRLGR